MSERLPRTARPGLSAGRGGIAEARHSDDELWVEDAVGRIGEGQDPGACACPACDADGAHEVAIHWKSGVDPLPETLDHCIHQIRGYREITGTKHGLMIAVASGIIVRVRQPRAPRHRKSRVESF